MILADTQAWMHTMTGVFALRICQFVGFAMLVHPMHILSNRSQIFRRNLVLDILAKKEEKMMPPHCATGV